jgi:phage shock protein A
MAPHTKTLKETQNEHVDPQQCCRRSLRGPDQHQLVRKRNGSSSCRQRGTHPCRDASGMMTYPDREGVTSLAFPVTLFTSQACHPRISNGVHTMGIFSRTRDIIAANVTDLLDKAEDPAKMIRMIIMEMEETLVEVRATAARTIADQKEMRRHITKLETLQASWTEKAELALSKDREDLAKAALVERQKATDMAEHLNAEIEALDDALRASEADIAKLQSKLREARTRQNSVLSRLETANNRIKVREAYAGAKVDEAFSRFDILERRVDYAEGRADALYMGQEPKSLEEEINELKSNEKVDADLAALKASMKKG